MSSGNVLDQTSTATAGSSSTSSNNPTNPNNNGTANNNNNTAFQPVRNNSDNMGHTFENPMQMFAMKQQPMASPVTGTIYTGPPAKYLSNGGGMNSNGYATGGPMRPMLPPQAQNRYGSYNGSNNNNNNNGGGGSSMPQRRQNNSGVDNATNDSVK
jgi:hypothetical protein